MKKYTLGETRFLNIFSENFNTRITNELLYLTVFPPESEGEPRFLVETRKIKLSNRKYEIEFGADFYNNLDEVIMDEHNMFACYTKIIIDPATIDANFNVKDKKGFLRTLKYVNLLETFQKVIIKHFTVNYKNILIESINLLRPLW